MKPIKLLSIVILMSLVACVPQRKYLDLESKFNDCEANKKECVDALKIWKEKDSACTSQMQLLDASLRKLRFDSVETNTILVKTKQLYNDLSDTYERLLKYNKEENNKFDQNLKNLETRSNLTQQQLDAREAEIARKNKELADALADLKSREAKVMELQNVLAAKDSSTKALKATLVSALLGYKDAGLEVNIKNGKVYVSLSDQLLFSSGSYVVDKKGHDALLKLADVLQKQSDINIMVEGHTDDVPMKSEKIADNWDLSVLRANSIVRILSNEGNIDPKRLLAAGRGEYMPIDPARTPEARKKNRRTEIILSPQLDQLLQVLEGK